MFILIKTLCKISHSPRVLLYIEILHFLTIKKCFVIIAVCHTHVHEILLQHLEYLNAEELNLFKWHLTEGVEAFKKIPKRKLEKAERWDIVTCMIDQCEVDGAAKLTVTILGKMQKNNDAKQLQEKLDMKGKAEFSIHRLCATLQNNTQLSKIILFSDVVLKCL